MLQPTSLEDLPPPPPGFILTVFLKDLLHLHNLGLASLTFFLYDILLTLADEVKYIHRGSRWNLPKCLYLMNRYLVLLLMAINTVVLLHPAPLVDLHICYKVQYLSRNIHKIGFGPVLVWLMLRVYALWGRDRRIFTVLFSAWVANSTLSLTITGRATNFVQPIFVPKELRLPGMTGCALNISPAPTYLWVTFVSCVVYEAIVVSFTIARGVIQWKAGYTHAKTPLTKHLYQTGVGYFLVMALTMTIMSAAALTPLQQTVLPTQFLSAMISCVCARMMLGIRSVINYDDHLSAIRPSEMHISNFNLTSAPISLIEFPSYMHESSEEQGISGSSSSRKNSLVKQLTVSPPFEDGRYKDLPPDMP